MVEDGEGGDAPRHQDDLEAEEAAAETGAVLEGGQGAGNRSGGLAFLAFAVLVAAAVHFHFSSGGDAYLARLDSELLTHAELALSAREGATPVAVVPSWPLRLYGRLREDIALYAAAAAVAAYLWGLSARARARRDAYLVHEKLAARLDEALRRLDRLEGRTGGDAGERNGTEEQ